MFGYGRPAPEGTKFVAWYGARAIFTDNFIDIVYDRQSWYIPGVPSTEPEYAARRKTLADWVSLVGLPYLTKATKNMPGNSPEVVTFDDGNFHIEASPQRSHGYLYIGAWMKTE